MNLTASVASAFVMQHLFGLILASIALVFELILRTYQQQLKSGFKRKVAGLADETDIERVSIEYYSHKQRLSLFHALVIALLVLIGLLAYDVRAFSYVAVALAAGIMVFKEMINSLISYFFILSNFRVGDDISILGVRGEVLHIRPLVTTVLGKGDDAEYNGRVTSVPNYQFTWTPVERKEMKRGSYLMASMDLTFIAKDHDYSFGEYVHRLREHLDHYLPLRSMKNVGYYRSYAGVRYKLDFWHNGDGHVVIRLTFVSKSRAMIERKQHIMAFVESLRKS